MDPSRISAQDVMRCDLCETAVVQMHCDTCLANLCKACVGEHISNEESMDHKVVKFRSRKSISFYVKCASHEKGRCEMYCSECEKPVCRTCMISDEHGGHTTSQLLEVYNSKKEEIMNENNEMEQYILPTYEKEVSETRNRIEQLEKDHEGLLASISEHSVVFRGIIENVVDEMKTQVSERKDQQLESLEKHLAEIQQKIALIRQTVNDNSKHLEQFHLLRQFKQNGIIVEFRKPLPKCVPSLPSFQPSKIGAEQLSRLFGTLVTTPQDQETDVNTPSVMLDTTTCHQSTEQEPVFDPDDPSRQQPSEQEYENILATDDEPEVYVPNYLTVHEDQKVHEAITESTIPKSPSAPAVLQIAKEPLTCVNKSFEKLLKEPVIVGTMDTDYSMLYNVTGLSCEEIWTSGNDRFMKLFSFSKGILLKKVRTESKNTPSDITVTKNGDLVYADGESRTVNVFRNNEIKELIRLQNWKPLCICSASSGDLLLTMQSDNHKQSKVVRYAGSTETQTIQFDEEGKPLYSSGSHSNKYITENRNLDICVVDNKAKAVVVVNQAGKLRFRYTGHTLAPRNKPFRPRGIATDSSGQILTADDYNQCIHVIDKDGGFLRYILCGLRYPWGLYVDTNDNLLVAENTKVAKIRYLK